MEQEKIKQLLLTAKQELEKRVTTIHDHARRPLNADSSEQAAELGNVAVVSALESEAVEELADIDAALQRIENGSYGICTACGEAISEQRLEARPESTDCVDCANLT